jgi:hypothetical protein
MVELADELSSQIKSSKLTPEILRMFSGCEHYTNEEAVNIVESIEKLAEIFLKIDSKKLPDL